MCMDKRNEIGETLFIFAGEKISEAVKLICSFVNYVTLYVLFV